MVIFSCIRFKGAKRIDRGENARMKKQLITLTCITALGLGVGAQSTLASYDSSSATSGTVALTDTLKDARVTVNAGGGKWDYGSTLTLTLKKKTHSNYFHESKMHGSSAKVGEASDWTYSGDTKPGQWSKASATGEKDATGYAKWNIVD